VLSSLAQESKPDDSAKLTTPRAGQKGVGIPVCIHCPLPEYSNKARTAKVEGLVVLDVTVTPEGKATNIIVVKGPGEGLEEKAIDAVKLWMFKPVLDKEGNPISVRVTIQVAFHLRK